MEKKVVSIIISNYNYEKFVRDAIDSAINQSYYPTEVIVVDDGSTDASREILAEYGDKIIPIVKQNGGQASAFNAGFNKSIGDVIIFLDSDDLLYNNAIENAIGFFENNSIAKVHWPLELIDGEGVRSGGCTPGVDLPEGSFKEHALQSGPPFFLNPPTSGNAWSRKFIESVMPIPEAEFRIGADTYLFETVAFFGTVKKMDIPQGSYRIHSHNNYHHKSFAAKLKEEISFYDCLFTVLEKYCDKLGIIVNPQIWKTQSWFHKLQKGIQDIKQIVPDHSSIILVDEAKWGIGSSLGNLNISTLLEKEGQYAGIPVDSQEAIKSINLLHEKGADFIVFVWSSFWWLDYFGELRKYLCDHFTLALQNDHILVFDLKKNS